MSDDMSGVSRSGLNSSSWIAIPQAMQQHGQSKRAMPSKETAPIDRANTVATTSAEQTENKRA